MPISSMWSCFCKTWQFSQATMEWQLPLFLLIFWLTFIIIWKLHKFLYCGVFVWSSIHSSIERLEEWFYPLWQIQINDICNKKCSMFSKNGISAHNAPCIENLYNSIVDEPQLKYQGFHQVITYLINHPTPLTYYICN